MSKRIYKKIFVPIIIGIFAINLTIPVFAEHTHTDNCYAGTKHICVGDETEGGTCYQKAIYHTHIDTCYDTLCKADNVEKTNTTSEELCDVCQQPISTVTYTCNTCLSTNETTGCHNPECEKNVLDPILTHKALSIEQAKQQNITICNKTSETIEKYEKTCSKTNGNYYNSSNIEVTPMCSYIITSIEAVYKEQNNINKLDKTIKITYMDGHTEIKTATLSDFNGDTSITQNVNLTWTGIKDAYGNEGQFFDTINYYLEVTPTPTPTQILTPTPTQMVTTVAPTIEPQIENITLRPTMEPVVETITPTQITNDKVITPPQTTTEEVIVKSVLPNWLLIFIIIVIVIVLILATVTAISIIKPDNDDDDDDDYNDDDIYDDEYYDEYDEYDEYYDDEDFENPYNEKSSNNKDVNNIPFVTSNDDDVDNYLVPDVEKYMDK